ncbi:MAG TPA: hypothetical protein VFR68_05555 [Candidatus Dormibacteraeota bacterium]|nr:hypothetical protein [Candidatus Dormibacteraeota bacterium]
MNAAGIVTKPARALVLASGLIAATSSVAFAQDVTVALGTMAGVPVTNAYLNPPFGHVVLGTHQFDLSSGNMIQVQPGQTASISGSYPNTSQVYVLLNSYNSYGAYKIGQIVMTFSDGTTLATDLVTGGNIREWRPGDGTSGTINTATDTHLVNVWTGQAQPAAGGGTAIIDMLTINLPAGQYKTLTNITMSVTSLNNPYATGMIVPGITINDGVKHCIRPGKSCHTSAEDQSKAWKWQPELPGATNTNPHQPSDENARGND